MSQLKLSTKQLKEIGFTKTKFGRTTVYKIPVINGFIYYNPLSDVFTWYLYIEIEGMANHTHLDISKLPELYTLLQVFRVSFKLIII